MNTESSKTPRRANHLAGEKSPYLLQHAHNPVDWFPWGEAAFAKARSENKPILLNFTGSDWCGPCKVMSSLVFTARDVAEAADGVVCVVLDGDKEKELVKQYKVEAYPTGVFLDEAGDRADQRAAQVLLDLVLSASSVIAAAASGSAWSVFLKQVVWLAFGCCAFLLGARVDYHRWQRWAGVLWVAALLLCLAVFIPASGWIADRFGARQVFCAAIGFFTLGSVLCGLSETLSALVLSRIVQGFGGAMMTPVGRLILVRSFPRDQLYAALTLIDRGVMSASTRGAMHGEIGHTQFLPKNVLLYGATVGVGGIDLNDTLPDAAYEEIRQALWRQTGDVAGAPEKITGAGEQFAREFAHLIPPPLRWRSAMNCQGVSSPRPSIR